ncbi:replicative DNA helicase [Sediminispirochaeta smaragdinae]|uniref:Replicative DNA helicase n=1 Tax=Sediminispirochaeta smaragdinae (strain DSM 11293 / JCM 15392 / SEBR 4228) TaxID=573413 RepID=E1R292_SEDSS|nr:replicative DNA helicase [Sediminispirochaeta smaragdinae]ADK81977.1 replicative DNA helicase [Sediminispirochaeta smaragdinae DSM 11293]
MNSPSLKDKVPPHNSEAEAATLGAMLLDPEAVGIVLRHLRPEDFYSGYNRNIYSAILSLFNKGQEVDLITLTDELRATGKLEASGGASYATTLTSVVPTSANVEYYAKIVKDSSIRRSLLKIAAELTSQSHDESIDSRELIEEAERKIFDITDNQQTGSYRGANEIINETIAAIEKLYHTKNSYTGIPSGFPDLDNMTSGFQRAEFIVIGARPSVGKTAFALSMAANMSIKKSVPIGFFTLEMSAQALMQRLVSSEARINSRNLRTGFLKPSDFYNLTEAAGRIYEAPLFIDDTPNIKLLDLRAQARRMRSKEGVEALFIDYIGLIEPENKGNVPRHEQVAEISRSLKSLARELDIPIISLSQVGRQSEGKAPTLADLRESGSIEQDADVVMFLHRERESGKDGEQQTSVKTELIVAKQRNGPVGTIEIAFIPHYTKFESLARE